MFSKNVVRVPGVMIIGAQDAEWKCFSEEAFENHLHTQCDVWVVAPDKFHSYSDVKGSAQGAETLVAPVDPFHVGNSRIRFRSGYR